MATIGAESATLADLSSRLEDKKIAKIVELLNDTNEVIDDMKFMEGNLATGHKSTMRSGLPDVTWRMLYQGVPNSKSKTVQVTDTTGMLEAYSEVDKSLADLNGNTAAFRLSESSAFLESMSQEFASTVFYGNTQTDPEKFMGLAPRYNSLSAHNAENVISGGGSGSDNTSIYLVVWGDRTVHGIFPKGSKLGLSHQDLGEQTLLDSDGNKFQGYRSHYKWDAGLVLRDWRYVVRICNIDVTALKKDAATGADLVDLLSEAVDIPPSLTAGNAVIYCNRTILSFLRRQTKNSNNVRLTMDQVAGKKVRSFDEIPVRRCDTLLNTEATVA